MKHICRIALFVPLQWAFGSENEVLQSKIKIRNGSFSNDSIDGASECCYEEAHECDNHTSLSNTFVVDVNDATAALRGCNDILEKIKCTFINYINKSIHTCDEECEDNEDIKNLVMAVHKKICDQNASNLQQINGIIKTTQQEGVLMLNDIVLDVNQKITALILGLEGTLTPATLGNLLTLTNSIVISATEKYAEIYKKALKKIAAASKDGYPKVKNNILRLIKDLFEDSSAQENNEVLYKLQEEMICHYNSLIDLFSFLEEGSSKNSSHLDNIHVREKTNAFYEMTKNGLQSTIAID
ncbi:hypothetical protein ENBRE01_0965 [Enteropsectra breve]|nr:hypothetical protein ENBRE01_0965 [Enteropsectra breve]